MKINGQYHIVDWKAFKRVCVQEAPEGYKFKKKEIKNMYKCVVGTGKHKRRAYKKKNLTTSH